jgi:predicted lipoprotein
MMNLARATAFGLLITFAHAPQLAAADPVVDAVVDTVALPGFTVFAAATAELALTADEDCRANSPQLRDAWHLAMDAWFGVQDMRLGPLEDDGWRQIIAYRPDSASAGGRPRALARLLATGAPALSEQAFADQSIALRGLYALEAILFDPTLAPYAQGDVACLYVQRVTHDLAQSAEVVRADWHDRFADILRTAGDPENPRFLAPSEARQALMTALLSSIEFDENNRIGLPLGSIERPRPMRAEGLLSQRSARNLSLSLAAHLAFVTALAPSHRDAVATKAGLRREIDMLAALNDPTFANVATPEGWQGLRDLGEAIERTRQIAELDLVYVLGVSPGLNALDGD